MPSGLKTMQKLKMRQKKLAVKLGYVEKTATTGVDDAEKKADRVEALQVQIDELRSGYGADITRRRRETRAPEMSETAPTPAPSVPPESVVMPSPPAPAMTKTGIVKAHMHRWPTIESDLSDASRNGLSVAKAGERRWDERKALEWARSRGKLHGEGIAPAPADPMAALFGRLGTLPSHRHGG